MDHVLVDLAQSPVRATSRLHRRCIGSCHAYLTLREDWRDHVRRLQAEIGFESMRFHGILHDWMGVYREGPKGEPFYCFYNVDKVYDFLLSLGIKPFVELGFMPSALASGDRTIFTYEANVTPPRDHARWAELVTRFTEHLIARYGREEVLTWPFEVWNEPNLRAFWSGTQEDYFRLYAVTARALKAVDPRLQVGGPATAKSDWVPEFLAFCARDGAPVDFVSSHHYCCEAELGWELVPPEKRVRVYRGKPYMRQTVAGVRDQIAASASPGLPLHYTEWNVSPMHEDRFGKDSEFTATFALSTLRDLDGLLESYSWWTISDVFEESGPGLAPFSGKYGLCSLHGIMKSVGHAFRFLSKLHPEQLLVPADNQLLLTRDPAGRGLRLLAWNHVEPTKADFYGKNWDIPDASRELRLALRGLRGPARVRQWLVDRHHGNGFRAWQDRGARVDLSPAELAALRTAAEAPCVADAIVAPSADGLLELALPLGPCAFRYVEIDPL